MRWQILILCSFSETIKWKWKHNKKWVEKRTQKGENWPLKFFPLPPSPPPPNFKFKWNCEYILCSCHENVLHPIRRHQTLDSKATPNSNNLSFYYVPFCEWWTEGSLSAFYSQILCCCCFLLLLFSFIVDNNEKNEQFQCSPTLN